MAKAKISSFFKKKEETKSDINLCFSNSNLYNWNANKKWPFVYHPNYNIYFFGIEKVHPFDSAKWGKVNDLLIEGGVYEKEDIYTAREATENDLSIVHTSSYLDSLKWSTSVARITEVPLISLLPNLVVQRKALYPLRLQTGGSIMSGKLAIEHGWSINIGGGFHHCSATRGGGFCVFADISLLIKFVFHHYASVRKVMIVDLDAHQGNGHERDFMNEDRVFILDIYNRNIYPQDGFAKRAIKRKVELTSNIESNKYLELVKVNLEESLTFFSPDLVVYNAGTDILDGDLLGCMQITPQGVQERDEIVFRACRNSKRPIPIAMLTSGGYQQTNASIISKSIISLQRNGLIKPLLNPA